MINADLLKKLRKGIGYGGVRLIAKELDLSPTHVSQVLRGMKNNTEVLDAAAELVKINEQKRKSVENKIKKAIKNIN